MGPRSLLPEAVTQSCSAACSEGSPQFCMKRCLGSPRSVIQAPGAALCEETLEQQILPPLCSGPGLYLCCCVALIFQGLTPAASGWLHLNPLFQSRVLGRMRKEQLSTEPLSTLLTERSQLWLKLDTGSFFFFFPPSGGEAILPPEDSCPGKPGRHQGLPTYYRAQLMVQCWCFQKIEIRPVGSLPVLTCQFCVTLLRTDGTI